jgi:hypothetical protein
VTSRWLRIDYDLLLVVRSFVCRAVSPDRVLMRWLVDFNYLFSYTTWPTVLTPLLLLLLFQMHCRATWTASIR